MDSSTKTLASALARPSGPKNNVEPATRGAAASGEGAAGGEESAEAGMGLGEGPWTGARKPSNAESKESEDKNHRVELRLQVRDRMLEEKIEVVRVCPDTVDLSAHKGLVALPEELRRWAGRVCQFS